MCVYYTAFGDGLCVTVLTIRVLLSVPRFFGQHRVRLAGGRM